MAIINWQEQHGDFFKGSKVVVTGGAGFIGSHITEALIDLGASVTVIDDLSGGDVANFDTFKDRAGTRLTFVEASILDNDALTKAVDGARYVMHQAALGSVPRSIEQPVLYHQVNTTGTLNVLEAARHAGVERVTFAASSSAYGDSETLPKIESMPVWAKSPYAANKAACEALMRAYADSYGLDTASLRYFNIFGPRQNANSAYAAVIAAFAKSIIANETPKIFGDGEQSRDFTFVDNAVHANLLAARSEKTVGGKVFNVACGKRITVNELAVHMAEMMGKPNLTPEHLPERAGDVKHSLADLTAIEDAINYTSLIDFETGLKPTVDWYIEDLTQSAV
ncbi:UDP-glucose 4-epimerase [Poriferisphaera corsica]|uniref:UDP-glucose 4-epimerase n=1 Tax=Poriferisphaera corsica TaxID=2528020 RepID=A0A517YXE9_9BACT|nr:NAD-dependent epimerase/dehydratase family protein [Poriferisphaera corsica]QDU34891.1 UDP-glucose 4-epimerase [Poriferisphaera corsica]